MSNTSEKADHVKFLKQAVSYASLRPDFIGTIFAFRPWLPNHWIGHLRPVNLYGLVSDASYLLHFLECVHFFQHVINLLQEFTFRSYVGYLMPFSCLQSLVESM